MSDLSDAAPWIAIGAAAAAVAALILSLAFYLKLRAVRKAQLVLLGTGKDDLVNFAVSLQTRIDDLHRVVDEVAAGSRGSTGGSTVASHTRPSSGTTPTRTRAGTSPPRSPSSTAPVPGLS